MSSYHIEIEVEAAKALAKIGEPDRTRIARRIEALAQDPRPSGCEKLKGMSEAFRVRRGNYRIIYTVDDVLTVVNVTRIGNRKDVYR